mgnify:CR=1 FL=1
MDAYERIRKYQSGELLPARTGYAYLDKALLGGLPTTCGGYRR